MAEGGGFFDMFSQMGMGGSGGGKGTATSSSSQSVSASNALDLAFNPNVFSSIGGQLWPTSNGNASSTPSSTSNASASAQSSPTENNPSAAIPWYYPGGGYNYDVGQYKGTGTYGSGTSSVASGNNAVLFMMLGIALIFLMKR